MLTASGSAGRWSSLPGSRHSTVVLACPAGDRAPVARDASGDELRFTSAGPRRRHARLRRRSRPAHEVVNPANARGLARGVADGAPRPRRTSTRVRRGARAPTADRRRRCAPDAWTDPVTRIVPARTSVRFDQRVDGVPVIGGRGRRQRCAPTAQLGSMLVDAVRRRAVAARPGERGPAARRAPVRGAPLGWCCRVAPSRSPDRAAGSSTRAVLGGAHRRSAPAASGGSRSATGRPSRRLVLVDDRTRRGAARPRPGTRASGRVVCDHGQRVRASDEPPCTSGFARTEGVRRERSRRRQRRLRPQRRGVRRTTSRSAASTSPTLLGVDRRRRPRSSPSTVRFCYDRRRLPLRQRVLERHPDVLRRRVRRSPTTSSATR